MQNSEGKWSYYEDDAKVKCDSRFDESDYKYYVLDSKGYRHTKPGLYTASYFYTYYGDKVKYKRSFYVQSDGSLLRFSWKKIDGKWYYFNYDGMMEKGMVRSKEDKKQVNTNSTCWEVTAPASPRRAGITSRAILTALMTHRNTPTMNGSM